jgi:hypothetical protein
MSSEDGKYGLEFSFGIDNGELDSHEKHECFVLGFEFCQVYEKLKLLTWRGAEQMAGIEMTVHAANKDRIEQACRKHGLTCKTAWMQGDRSEEWIKIEITK